MAKFFNEMAADGIESASSAAGSAANIENHIRDHYREFNTWLKQQSPETIQRKRAEADLTFRRVGITFAVYGDDAGTERLIPFDIIPRIIPASEWSHLQTGLVQRVKALNMFIHDIYHDQNIIKAGIIPAEQIYKNAQYRPEMQGISVASDIYAHIAGVDIVRAGAGEFYVLEDNLRVPSGVSYMLEDRKMMMRLFPELFARNKIAPVDHYPDMLLDNLRSVAPVGVNDPTIVVMTPGMYNSAYFEHAFLAQQMGVELVEGKDLFVNDNAVFMRTTRGPKRVDVIYRRVDDDFLDPLAFRPDSSLGVPGLLSVYRAGRVTLANAIGTGVADDKSIYPFVPDMIKFYLTEQPILNNVPTYQCRKPEDLAYTLAHLPELVVKEVHGAGGYGMLVGPASTKAQIEDFRQRLLAKPDGYIAQPTLALSACPTYVESGIAPRHIDLRPFVLSGKTISMVPGGLTRVALQEGSLVVNSSQGGGTKDTWILEK
ncbi:circularly permuted type 2 ATP-grasp protein [Undibacterium sp. RTI2.1]|uniref:circularly permuted type 2 ATP-grasp protein n=1 Tax=unclassified Undibacterium TaxID=2630295 RepID=UPI002AB59481|nr:MULTISPECIES: circularly permuted type 2 ATP-grasp protein [unclassified Undibacterium]MDY7539095.1 circularly permuted type 2 ATP-grasp protein [Undibacterium sp. 5I1]MEB0030980.1 circularly permuted type 2 ATP-grasp protein [Undibacterium sp. RTI2.1]MEB0115827.1 circularly permuted type 2 ATP-grasp protein [Undibacterium sp. RTI2.2]MEB0229771.1 circularly permuted type 2 ATP-grasp protein [Undibacterium sp. 10I3]MEB0258324.1 circularly permuted type 2 ATP-grasp protein [Undibacterium sp. 